MRGARVSAEDTGTYNIGRRSPDTDWSPIMVGRRERKVLVSFVWTRELIDNILRLYPHPDLPFVKDNHLNVNYIDAFIDEPMDFYFEKDKYPRGDFVIFDITSGIDSRYFFVGEMPVEINQFKTDLKYYQGWFNSNPGITRIKIFRYFSILDDSITVSEMNEEKTYPAVTYIFLFTSKEVKLAIIGDTAKVLDLLKNSGVEAVNAGGTLIFNKFDYPIHQKLSQLIPGFPSWQDITKFTVLEQILSSSPELLREYMDKHPEDYPILLELTKDAPTYTDLLIEYGIKYIDAIQDPERLQKINIDQRITELLPIVLARFSELRKDQVKKILTFFLKAGLYSWLRLSNYDQTIINRLFSLMVGKTGITEVLPFNIKLDVDTLFNLAELLASKK